MSHGCTSSLMLHLYPWMWSKNRSSSENNYRLIYSAKINYAFMNIIFNSLRHCTNRFEGILEMCQFSTAALRIMCINDNSTKCFANSPLSCTVIAYYKPTAMKAYLEKLMPFRWLHLIISLSNFKLKILQKLCSLDRTTYIIW